MKKFIGKIYIKSILFFARRYDDLLVIYENLLLKTYFSKLRIINIYEKEIEIEKNDNICIFIIYEKDKIPDLTLQAIEKFKKENVKVLTVVNSKINNEYKNLLGQISDIVMYRNNTGKDFGGYKDAFIYLKEKNYLSSLKKIIFANDSVIYPKNHASKIIQDLLNSNADLTGYSDVEDIHYHVQSFLFSCSNSLINDKTFINFWNRYKPISRRRYMIKKGEVGLTKAVIKSGKTITTLNKIDKILDEKLTLIEINEIINLMPTRYINESKIFNQINKINKIKYLNYSEKFKKLNADNKDLIKKIQDAHEDYCNIKLNQFKHKFIYMHSKFNNTSFNTFIFLLSNQNIVLKRDSVIRAGYSSNSFYFLLQKFFPDEYHLMWQMIKKPTANHFKGIKKVMFDNGII